MPEVPTSHDFPTIHGENKARDSNTTGYLITILIFLFVQTGAAFYWAGGLSRGQDTQKDQIQELKQTVDTLRNQYQVLSMQLSELQGQQNAVTKRIK